MRKPYILFCPIRYFLVVKVLVLSIAYDIAVALTCLALKVSCKRLVLISDDPIHFVILEDIIFT